MTKNTLIKKVMNKVISLFEYIHYRIFLFFKGREDNISEFTATLVLSLMQFLTIINIIFIVQLIHDFPIPSKFAFLPLLIVLGIVNWYLYERNFDAEKVERKWEEEDVEKRKRTDWLIGIYILVSFLFPMLLGIDRKSVV